MKNVHRLSLMVLTVLTVAFLAVDLPLMAQRAQQQKGAQQGAPQQKDGLDQPAPTGAGTAQIDKSSPKLSPQQEQRVGQLKQQAQSLFRNLQRVLGELQRLPKRGTQGLGGNDDPTWIAGQPNPRGPQRRPGPQPGTRGLAEPDDSDGAKPITDGTSNTIGASTNRQPLSSSDQPGTVAGTSNPSGGVVDGDRIAQTGYPPEAYIKFDGLVKQAQQIVNNVEGIGNEAKALGFLTLDGKGNDLLIFQTDGVIPNLTGASYGDLYQLTGFAPQQLQQMGKELKEFGVIWPQFLPSIDEFKPGGDDSP